MASLLSGICLGKPGKQCHKSGPVQGGCAGIEVLDPLWPPYWKATQISNDSRGGKAERGKSSSKNRWDCAKCDGKDKLGTGAPCASSASYPTCPPPKVRERWQ